ncbi:MAG: rod shape-determining protein MreD [Acidimicrobiales bacterium]|nr:rod shape-determining protein MreD [Acidimicrobiales bacterium]
MIRAVRFSLVLVVLLTIQTTWMADLRPFGVVGDLLLLLAIAGGMAAGPVRGATVGFIAGFALDLVLLTPLGLAALTYLAVGYAVGTVHDGVLRSAPWIPVLVTFVASAVGVGFYVVLGQLMGQQFRLPDLARIVLVTSTINAFLAVPALHAMRWVEKSAPDRMLGQPARSFR